MKTRQSRKLEMLHAHSQFEVALRLIKKLQEQGFDAVLAGGCVRDGLLGISPKDLDVATSAPPDVVEKSFAQTLAVGKAFGTIVVIENGHNFEVTTFRREGGYSDGRHPDRVEFTDMKEDAQRRDFTVNALFYDPWHQEIFDFVEGLKDLERRVLRTVGVAEERFDEDKLRMLRAPRFVAQLGFELDEKAFQAIVTHHKAIDQVSPERIFNEMRRMLSSRYLLNGLRVFRDSKLTLDIWPELLDAKLERLEDFGPFPRWELAFAAVMLLSAKSNSELILRAWKAPRDSIRKIQSMMDGCKTLMNSATTRAGRMRVIGGEEFAGTLQLAQGFLSSEPKVVEKWIKEFLEVTGESGKLPQPFVTGQDLIAAGLAPGAEMGNLLRTLYDEQLEGRLGSREEALAAVTKSQR